MRRVDMWLFGKKIFVIFLIWSAIPYLTISSESQISASTALSFFQRPFDRTTIDQLTGQPQLRSTEGRGIPMIVIPAIKDGVEVKKPKFRFYLQAALHGNERETVRFLKWLSLRIVLGHSLLNQLPQNDTAFDIVLQANPDGYVHNSRYNARGVNLNRNFPVHWGRSREPAGASAGSEKETQAIRYLLATRQYTAAVDIHGFINWVVGPSIVDQGMNLSSKVLVKRESLRVLWHDHLKSNLKKNLSHYLFKTGYKLGDGGDFEDYAYWQHGIMAYCLELDVKQNIDDRFLAYERFIYESFVFAIKTSSKDSLVSL